MKEFRSKDRPVILCSAGDFYGGADVFSEPKSHLIARIMGYLQYDAIGVGEMDLNYGLEKLVEDAQKYQLEMTCANLIAKDPAKMVKSGKTGLELQKKLNTVFPPFKIVERGNVRVGFIALLSPRTKIRTVSTRAQSPGMEEVEAITYTIKNPAEIAPLVIPEVRKKCDVLVMLAHMDMFDLEALLPDYPEIDAAVIGHNNRSAPLVEPMWIGTVPVYRATSQGQNVGRVQIALDENKKIVDRNNKIYFLNESVSGDPEVAAMLDDFDKENRKIQKALFAKEQLKAASYSSETADVYMGVGACMDCHADAFDVYVKTGHARAYRTLSSQFMHRDAECVSCHSTGYGQTGGFTGLRRVGSPVDLIDVQCEACHGPGVEHSRDGKYLEPAARSCERCHTKEQDPDFDFEEAWLEIAH